jgi:hypothetical protein
MDDAPPPSEFQRLYSGRHFGVMSWNDLGHFWQRLDAAAGWYLNAVGEPVPTEPATEEEVRRFVHHLDTLLRKEHHEDYCGIVYADDLASPRLVKIYDPHHQGSSCGSSKHPPLPGWIMSRDIPCDLNPRSPLPAARRRWWQNLFDPATSHSA